MNRVIFYYYGIQTCCVSKFHGAGEYGNTVLKYLVENYSDIVTIAIIYNPVSPLEDWLGKVISDNGVTKLEVKNEADIPMAVERFQPDIFYSPISLSPDIRKQIGGNVLLKETIHDFRTIELIEDIKMIKYMPFRSAVKNIVKWSTKRIYRRYLVAKVQKQVDIVDSAYCVSKHTYYSMQILFGNLCEKKISVFYSPGKYVSEIKNHTSPLKEDRYILTLGGDRWTKNPFRAILALDSVLSMERCDDYKVVVVGEVSKQIKKRIKNANRFVFSDYVDAEVLERYYENCEIFVYVSLNEGFGYPPMEAMKYGKTCIVSGTSSMPEICGEAVYYVNPYNVLEIAEKVMMALNEKIDESIINQRVNYINQKQLADMKDMCDDIVSG